MLLLPAIILILIVSLLWIFQANYRRYSLLKKIPGPKPNFILGNLIIITKGIFRTPPLGIQEVVLQTFVGIGKLYRDGIFRFWIGWTPSIITYRPETVEGILSSSTEIDKSVQYRFLHPWLGTGLLTSTGQKWRIRRKMLTPTFHFKILEDFIPIIDNQSKVMVNKLRMKECVNDIVHYITMCTLDIICETAMGVNIKAQDNPDSEYVKSLYNIGESFSRRTISFIGQWDWIYFRTFYGKRFLEGLSVLHEFTRNVIRDRKCEAINAKQSSKNSDENDDSIIGRKKRMAFLDLLLERHLSDPSQFTEEDIREEVDTFMFEGHDTTAMGITWTLYLLGLYDEHQQKVYDELNDIFCGDTERAITGEDLKQMKYLEYCIKEALRLYPSVPGIGRVLKDDFQIGNATIPKGTITFILIFMLHHNADIFPNPEIYDPNRFLPEMVSRRHPFAYIPFSAGPRNCIGQKFALTEEKIVVANVLRNFKIKSLDERDRMRIGSELVTRPRNDIRMQLYKRE